MRSGPIVISYDGTPVTDNAIREAGELLGPRKALVLVIYKQGLAFELLGNPTATIGLPPAPLDINTALEVDRTAAERAQQVAQHGAGLARDAGFDAEGLTVAEDVDTRVSEAVLRVARERDAQAIVIGAKGRGGIGEVFLSSTTRDIIRHAECPVVSV